MLIAHMFDDLNGYSPLGQFSFIFRAIAEAVADIRPRVRPVSLAKDHMLLSGLEPLKVFFIYNYSYISHIESSVRWQCCTEEAFLSSSLLLSEEAHPWPQGAGLRCEP
jgi:hypothetical protein